MGDNILVDTSVLISAQRSSVHLEQLSKYRSKLAISRITACELLYGSRNTEERKRNKELVDFFPIIELDPSISHFGYTLLDKYCLKVKLSIADAFIASTVIVKHYHLWTENNKHFSTIKGLELFDGKS